MRSRTIKSVLRRKIDSWIETIDDESLRTDLKDGVIVTGGAIPSMLLGETPKDYDVYLTSKKLTVRVANYYVKKFKSSHPKYDHIKVYTDEEAGCERILGLMDSERVYIYIPSVGVATDSTVPDDGEDYVEQPEPETKTPMDKYRPIYLSCNAITLSDGIQIVTRFNGSAYNIHKNYDFDHCKCYWESDTGTLVLPPSSLECILTKQLIYTGSKYPLCSIIRTRKFLERGWHITAGEYVKMAYQVSLLDLNNIDILADQLIGVDSAYFNVLINELESTEGKTNIIRYGSTYIIELIDKIFNGTVEYE